jgi:hypothetical protein
MYGKIKATETKHIQKQPKVMKKGCTLVLQKRSDKQGNRIVENLNYAFLHIFFSCNIVE